MMLYTDLGEACKVPVDSRISGQFCNILEAAIIIYNDCTPDHK